MKLLKHAIADDMQLHSHSEKPPPVFIDDNSEQHYLIEEIIDHRTRRGKLQYLVRWAGYPLHDATWEPEKKLLLDNANEAISDYRRKSFVEGLRKGESVSIPRASSQRTLSTQ